MDHQFNTRLLKQIHQEIESQLNSFGLLFRIFSRCKSESSLQRKLSQNPDKYTDLSEGKKIQDILGIRIALYFMDDLDITINVLKRLFEFDEESSNIDNDNNNTFHAKRCNLIFKIPAHLIFDKKYLDDEGYCDLTFEIQIRTILSEGWHEIEHDLRYKNKVIWEPHSDLDRTLNGVLASLETSEWAIAKILDEMAHRNYKDAKWDSMIRNKFRIRFDTSIQLSSELETILNESEIGKSFFRINRQTLIQLFDKHKLIIPITVNNVIYILNYFVVHNTSIDSLTPIPILSRLSEKKENVGIN